MPVQHYQAPAVYYDNQRLGLIGEQVNDDGGLEAEANVLEKVRALS